MERKKTGYRIRLGFKFTVKLGERTCLAQMNPSPVWEKN